MTGSSPEFMAAAIALSQRGRGQTGANPNVGCVIVKDNVIVGRGWTQPGGRPHAEAMALEQAGSAAVGSDIYTTLEPCAHKSDRGPSCSDLLKAAKPKYIAVATLDPDPRSHGKSAGFFREASISYHVGMLESEARSALAGFLSRIEKKRPFVTLKLAMSLDGCIALADGTSKWITGDRARAHGHLERVRSDAILVGARTIKIDNPSLDVRLEGLEQQSPIRVMLGSAEAPKGYLRLKTPEEISGLEGVNWLLVEGGASTAASFLKAGLVDRLLIYRAPIIIGGGLPGIADLGLGDLDQAHRQWTQTDRRQLGQDTLEIYERAA